MALERASADVQARVRFRSYVDEATLDDLYRRASVFAFLSEYEGFGLTPLEAMAHGAAPVVLDTPVAREIYGPAARYVALGPGRATRLAARYRAPRCPLTARAALVGRGAGGAVALRLVADGRATRWPLSRTPPVPDNFPTLAIIIVTHNSREEIGDCLELGRRAHRAASDARGRGGQRSRATGHWPSSASAGPAVQDD